MVKLNLENLSALPSCVMRPSYDRAELSAGIVHIGLGNFHRAHQAWYLHRLMQQGTALDWAVIGAGVRENDEEQRKTLAAQDYLSTLIELDPASMSSEVTGAMIDFIPVVAGNAALIERMAAADIRIVSMTVTEGGYFLDTATHGFDATHPDIVHDEVNPGSPRTAFGAMVEALRLRRARGHGPFTALSCDNLRGNGDILRQTLVSLARMSDPKLADWIATNCSFPNSMVDCIVPATGAKERALVEQLGVEDAAPVTHENFRQWVMEDDFCAGRPDWDQVGAIFTEDVHGYEDMKIRILNGGHQVIAVPGEVLGLETIADCMAHERVSAFFSKVARTEIAPHVNPVPGQTPLAYVDLVTQRFSNSRIVDTTRRVAFDGSSRHAGFIIPSIRSGLAAGTSIEGLALVEAAWARMCQGTRQDGSEIMPNDPHWDDLNRVAKVAREHPAVWLAQSRIYGDLSHQERFVSIFDRWLRIIWSEGLEAAIDTYLADLQKEIVR